MNVDLLKFETNVKTNEYLDAIFSNGFIPIITKPTRVSRSSATLIDHMYTNDITSSYHSGIIINDVADHFGIFCILKEKHKYSNKICTQKRSFNAGNMTKFKNVLTNTDFSNVLNAECPHIAYNIFLKLYLTAFNDSFPLRDIKFKSKYVKREPWFTSGLLTSSINRSKLLSVKLHKPTVANLLKFKQFNNLYNKLKRKIKILYFRDALEENKNNSKHCWKILKQAIGKINDKSSYPQTFSIHNSLISDKQQIADGFNNFFSNIGQQTSHNVPASNKNFSSYMPKPIINSMYFSPVTPYEVLDFTKKNQT